MTSSEGRPEGMAAPESATPEEIAARYGGLHSSEARGYLRDAIRLYAERRGEEERAKALEALLVAAAALRGAAVRFELASVCSQNGGRSADANIQREWMQETREAEAVCRRYIAAAPSGDAPECYLCDSPLGQINCPAHGIDAPSGDAKGTK